MSLRAVPHLLGLAVALWVAQTAFVLPGRDGVASSLLTLAIPVALVAYAVAAARRNGRMRGATGAAAVAGITGFSLLLFSIGLGLTALGLGWATLLVAAFGYGAVAATTAILFHERD